MADTDRITEGLPSANLGSRELGSRDFGSPDLYINRELSWLEFNGRVLELATRPDVPVLERLKFVAIAASNLDEFYMVRVGALKRQVARGTTVLERPPDGIGPGELLREIGRRAKLLCQDIASVLTETLLEELKKSGVCFLAPEELASDERAEVQAYYQREVGPCLTPIAIDPAHPFPHLRNGSLNIALRIEASPGHHEATVFAHPEGTLLALVQVPAVLQRFVTIHLKAARYGFMALEDVISMHAAELFPGHRILEARAFRVTRANVLDIAEDDASDLLTTIQDELRHRDRGEPVRLELSAGTSDELTENLRDMHGLRDHHVHRHPGFVAIGALLDVYRRIDLPALRDEVFSGQASPLLRYGPTLFRTIGERDVLLHHPYETFRHVIDFIDQAATDPDVVAIKQTLYRTSGDSPIVRALARAAEAGKQVTALVELKARFDEANNIAWARALEESGVHVVYGLIGLKTHCKILLVLRREGNDLRRYMHLSTGNYNPATARQYTDISLFTARDDMTSDAVLLFNLLTGYAELPAMQRLIVAPFTMRRHVMDMIAREVGHAQGGRPAAIRAKMNGLSDPEIIRALYAASQSGVKIDLLVRGICCLRPKVSGVSDNIRVRAITDRFLEHARISWWQNGGNDEVYVSSADWMPRNLNRRIEVSFPILDPGIKHRLIEEILATEAADNTFSWELEAGGTYTRIHPPAGEVGVRAQLAFIGLARDRAAADRTSVRPEILPQTATSAASPVLRAAEAQSKRRRSERRR